MMQPQAHLSIESMCRLGRVSRAGFYRHWQQREPRGEEMELRAQVQQIVVTHRRNYGYRQPGTARAGLGGQSQAGGAHHGGR